MTRKLDTSDINAWFDPQTVGFGQTDRIKKIRKACKEAAFALLDNTTRGSVEQNQAIMHVRQAMLIALSAIAVESCNAKWATEQRAEDDKRE